MAAAEAVPRFLVLGGNLPGLASAFFLRRSLPHARITVVEPSGQCGAGILSVRGQRGQLFEQGFHSSVLVNRTGREMLGLVKLLNLDEELISANIEASARRHLYHFGKVQLFPRLQHMLRYGPAILAEPLWSRSSSDDESVHDFVARRMSADVADRIADPICLGQFAGDARSLSVRTCFPRLWFNERRFRSVFLGMGIGMLPAHGRRSWLSLDLFDPLLQRVATGGRCYSFKEGLSTLVRQLEDRLCTPAPGMRPVEIFKSTAAVKLVEEEQGVEVTLSSGQSVTADAVLAATPPRDLAALLRASGLDPSHGDASMCSILDRIEYEPVTVVNLSFDTDVLRGRFRGAGYFCGSLEKQAVLGMSWDSQLFPQQAAAPNESRVTVYVGGQHSASSGNPEDVAMDAVRKHLGVEDSPAEVCATVWHKAVPQYVVGHHRKMQSLNAARRRHLPWLQVVGSGYFGARSPADEVVDARLLSDALSHRFRRFPGFVENETGEDVRYRYGVGFDAD